MLVTISITSDPIFFTPSIISFSSLPRTNWICSLLFCCFFLGLFFLCEKWIACMRYVTEWFIESLRFSTKWIPFFGEKNCFSSATKWMRYGKGFQPKGFETETKSPTSKLTSFGQQFVKVIDSPFVEKPKVMCSLQRNLSGIGVLIEL